VQPSTISKYRKHAILTCAILCAVLTPPDPASMVLLLIPTYGLYELGLVLLKAMPAKKLFKTESEMDGEPDE
jgi:sec-independent protein translocase protein TatC